MRDMKPQDLLKNWLRKNNMTAKDLAEKAGTNHSGIYRYLSGDTDSMRVSSAYVLSHATDFDLDVCDILGIPPRIVYRCLQECEEGCKKEDYSYTVDPSVCGINTPSSRISTYSVVEKQKKSKPKEKKKSVPDLQANALAVLAHWVSVFEKSAARVKLSPKRKTAVKKALEAKWSLDDIKHSIDGHGSNPWRWQEACRNELATILRLENIEAGMELYAEQGPAETTPVDDSWVHEQMAKEGD